MTTAALNTYNVDSAYSEVGEKLLGSPLVRAVYSRDLMFKAMPIMVFWRYAQEKTELGTEAGMTITMPTYRDIKMGGKLTEGVDMKTTAMTAYNKQITVEEWGNAIGFTEMAMRASFTNLMEDATTHLSRDLAKVADCYLRDVAMAGATIDGVSTPTIYARATKATPKPASVLTMTATNNFFSMTTVKDALELLATANAPKFEASYYVGVLTPHDSRQLRDDPNWIDVQKYASPENMLTGEIGKIDNVRFMETTLMPNGACAADDPAYVPAYSNATTSLEDVYASIIMGENYYGLAIGLPPEIRDDSVKDHGRKHSIAWYGIFGAAVLNPERAVIIRSC